MGVKCLNKYLKKKVKSGIRPIHLNELKGKTIAIDTSIYLYEFNIDDQLIYNFIKMLNILNKFDITPIFVFDGPPPKEKLLCFKNNKNITQTNKHDSNSNKITKEKSTFEKINHLNEIFSFLSHEINNPISSIRLAADLIKKKYIF